MVDPPKIETVGEVDAAAIEALARFLLELVKGELLEPGESKDDQIR